MSAVEPIVGLTRCSQPMVGLPHILGLLGAFAAPSSPTPEPGDADEQARVGDREYRFVDGEDLSGEVLRPGGAQIHTRTARAHKGLITVRGQFIDHLLRLSRDI